MDQLKDSLGSLSARAQAASSSNSGTEREPPNDPIVGRLLARLTANYGAPWGRSAEDMALMYRDWSDALSGLSEQEIVAAAKQWIATKDVWPKVANIRQIVFDNRPPATRPSFRAEKWTPRTPEEDARVSRTFEILDRIKKSGSKTPFTDLTNDPGYQQILSETPVWARGRRN